MPKNYVQDFFLNFLYFGVTFLQIHLPFLRVAYKTYVQLLLIFSPNIKVWFKIFFKPLSNDFDPLNTNPTIWSNTLNYW